MKLLEAFENLEMKQETDRSELLREVAKLEFNMSRAMKEHKEELHRYHDSIRTEVQVASDVNRLSDDLSAVRKDNEQIAAHETDTNYRLENIATRFFKFEKQIRSALELDGITNLSSAQVDNRSRSRGNRRRRHHRQSHHPAERPSRGERH